VRLATHDRGQVLDLAGANHLSPAIREGVPALVGEGETAGRTGWEPFFSALDRAGLALSWDTEDPSAVRTIGLAEAAPLTRHPSFADGMARTRRFVAVLRGSGAPPPAAQ
jgi:hypothetical protein